MSPLRRRMIEDMQIRNLTPNTQRVYVAQVVRFACHFGKSPDLLGPPEIRTYLLHLTQERRLAASSIIVTVSALRFFYHTTLKRPWAVEDDIPAGRQAKKLPVVLSQEEVARFLGAVDNLKHRIILTICYATGLRISEAVRLRPAAIDSKRMVIRVEQGKGRKDRYVMLPPKLLDMLRDYWKRAHPREWLFPGRLPGQPVSPLTIDLTCRQVREQCGIGKPVSPHSLRHAFAVHLLSFGVSGRCSGPYRCAVHGNEGLNWVDNWPTCDRRGMSDHGTEQPHQATPMMRPPPLPDIASGTAASGHKTP